MRSQSPRNSPTTVDNTILDVWRCDNFPPLGTTVVDGRDKWVRTDVVDFELQSAVTAINFTSPKCLSFAGYMGNGTGLATVRVADCTKGRASGHTACNFDAAGTLVNNFSGLCLQVHADKYSPGKVVSSGCLEADDVTSASKGGGCVDLVTCVEAAAKADNRSDWKENFACMATWGQCGGGGMRQAMCCSPTDACKPSSRGGYTDYMQCVPTNKSALSHQRVAQVVPRMVDAQVCSQCSRPGRNPIVP